MMAIRVDDFHDLFELAHEARSVVPGVSVPQSIAAFSFLYPV